ncbi:hypothetical protein GCM10027273_08360 [Nocardioides pakistanensis]
MGNVKTVVDPAISCPREAKMLSTTVCPAVSEAEVTDYKRRLDHVVRGASAITGTAMESTAARVNPPRTDRSRQPRVVISQNRIRESPSPHSPRQIELLITRRAPWRRRRSAL